MARMGTLIFCCCWDKILYLQTDCFASSVNALIRALTAAGREVIINRKLLSLDIDHATARQATFSQLLSSTTTDQDHNPLKNAPLW